MPVEEGGITLNLHNMVPQTRAEDEGVDPKPGVNDLNENLIKTIHYFLYPKDGTDQNTEKEPAKEGVLTGLSSQVDHSFSINVSKDVLTKTLFKYPFNDCDVYVIVNLPDGVLATASDHKLSTLRSMVVNADFDSSLKQESFVMEGLGIASIIDRGKVVAAEGDIEVSRIASKITVGVRVRESFITMDNQTSTNDQVWTPKPQDMLVELVNGATVAVLSGDPTKVEKQKLDTLDNQHRIFSDTDNDKIWTCDQFYSYPTIWDIGSDEEPYLRITLPCETTYDKNVNGEPIPYVDVQTCVYKVILGGERLKSNTWYDLTIDIAVLGNFESQEEVILPIENTYYFVADWSTGKSIASDILGGRYLVVDQEEYIIYNENTLSIPFTSSHECEIINATCKHPNLANNTINTVTNYSLSITGSNTVITYNKVLDNNLYSQTFDFTPYTTTFTIRHKDNANYHKTITIIQYPAIYGYAEQNTDFTNGGDNNGDNGFVWVNGYQGKPASGVTNFGGAYGANSSDLTAVSMYVFSISSLEGTDYIIGDPRTNDVDNLNKWNNNTITWATAPALYDNQTDRKLKYYYPTDADITLGPNDPTWNMIAPKFRVCSAYGAIANDQTNRQYYENVEGRCASYQEDGYPAGRWRLPTKAEFEFINTLSNRGLIPTLYVSTMDYWCAHGYGRYNNGAVSLTYNDMDYGSRSVSVRCVYDEWYWENSKHSRLDDLETFTWGDMPRESFQ